MGTSICGCNNSDNFNVNNYNNIETNLSKIEKYSYLKETQNISIIYDDLRTKSGTEWNNLTGLEKIIILYKINYIIKKYREHLKRNKDKHISDNIYSN